jgi:hypothetical protein
LIPARQELHAQAVIDEPASEIVFFATVRITNRSFITVSFDSR